MNTPTVESVLNHPFAVSSVLTNKNRLINYLNQHGYNERYGRNLYYQNFNRELPHIAEFLDSLQQEEELTKWLKNVEVEQTTQKPHDVRQEQYDMMNWMKNVEVEEPTQKPHDERVEYAIGEDINTMFKEPEPVEEYKGYLGIAFRKMEQYVSDETQHDVDWINLEPTASFQLNEKELKDIETQLLSLLRELLGTMKTDTSYVFEYQIVDEKGKIQNRFVHLSPQNTKILVDLLKDRGLIISDVEHFDPYEDEDLPFPSWAIIKQFKIRRHSDRFGKAPTDRFKPRQFTGERKQWTPRGGNFFRWFASSKLPKKLLDWLKRYQIITREEKDAKKILKDSCAVYAFKQA